MLLRVSPYAEASGDNTGRVGGGVALRFENDILVETTGECSLRFGTFPQNRGTGDAHPVP